ncbi:MAG: hypothetical protein EAZ07_01195 [Cytophagales bacterium]|nr:MAG: hypothetical protein EAZ07_01195 [Cytophagales bacterium]
MKQNNSIDKIFREKLQDGKAELPADSWLQIKDKLANSKSDKNNYFKIILSSLLVLVFITGGGIYTYQLYQQNQLLKTLINSNSAKMNSPSDSLIFSQGLTHQNFNSKKNSDLISPKYSYDKNLSTDKLSKQHNNDDDEHKVNNQKNISKQTDSSIRSVQKNNSALAVLSDASKQKKSIPKIVRDNNLKLNRQAKSMVTLDKNQVKENVLNGSAAQEKIHTKQKITNTVDENFDSLHLKSNTEISSGIVSQDKAYSNIPQQKLLSNAFENKTVKTHNSSSDSVLVVNSSELKKPVIDTVQLKDTVPQVVKNKKTKTPKGIGIALELMLNPEVTGRSIHFSDAPLSAEARNFKANDKSKFLYSGGLLVQLDFSERFYIKTGFLYSNFGEKNRSEFLLSSADTTFEKRVGASYYPIQFDSLLSFSPNSYSIQSIASTDRSSVEEIWVNNNNLGLEYKLNIKKTFNQVNTYFDNSISYIGIPIIVGTNLRFRSIKLGVFSGLISNFLISSSKVNAFSYVQNNKNETSLVNKEMDLASLTFTYWGGININYTLNSKWSLNISPSVKYFLGSIYQDKSILRQLPYAYGISFGLVYHIRDFKR